MKNKKRNGNKNKKENLDERPIDGDLFCLTNTTNYYKFLKVALNYADYMKSWIRKIRIHGIRPGCFLKQERKTKDWISFFHGSRMFDEGSLHR